MEEKEPFSAEDKTDPKTRRMREQMADIADAAPDLVAQLKASPDQAGRFDNLMMAMETRPCAECPKGEELVLVCSGCGDRIQNCACLAGSFRRTFIDPDTYDPDVDPFIWNTEI